jgi:hypothetical protein
VHVQRAIVTEVDEQMLPEGIGLAESGPIEQGGAIREATLGAADLKRLAPEISGKATCLAVDDMTLGHDREVCHRSGTIAGCASPESMAVEAAGWSPWST